MNGTVFQLLEEVVSRQYGAEMWDGLLATARIDRSHGATEHGWDQDLIKLAAAAAETLRVTPQEIIRWFGRDALPLLAQTHPRSFEKQVSTRGFVLSLNGINVPELRSLYQGTGTPEFDFDASSPEVLVLQYQSPHRLCAFVEGLIQGAAAYYRETVIIEHGRCMRRGDGCCRFELRFKRKAAAA